jgi:hypothetical protein
LTQNLTGETCPDASYARANLRSPTKKRPIPPCGGFERMGSYRQIGPEPLAFFANSFEFVEKPLT